jgi:toxin ParE1/3/4
MAERKPLVVWSPEALNDIDQLWNYYASVAGRGTADRILREIAKVVAAIDEFPLAGPSRDELRAGMRSLSAAIHVVFPPPVLPDESSSLRKKIYLSELQNL